MNTKLIEKREQLLAKRREIAEKARAQIKRIDAEVSKLNSQEKAQANEALRAIQKVGLEQLARPEIRKALQSLLDAKLADEANGNAQTADKFGAGGSNAKSGLEDTGMDADLDESKGADESNDSN